jgi:hypothetical protein
MAVIEVVAGVSWYDTFYDAALGAIVPEGWTKYGDGTVTVISDEKAYGGRALSFINLYNTGLGLDIAGSPEEFEVVMRFRASGESEQYNPFAIFGGPGGRIVEGGANGISGVGLGVQCSAYVQTCEFFCSLGYKTTEYPDWAAQLHTRGDGSRVALLSGNGESSEIGFPQVYSPYTVGYTGTYAKDSPSNISVPQPGGGTCYSNYQRGFVVDRYTMARFRVVNGRVSFRTWVSGDPESAIWHVKNVDVINMYWPQVAGAVGFVSTNNDRSAWYDPCYDGQDNQPIKTYVDMISVSLDPVGNPAYIPDAVNITSLCPLPNAKRGEAYSYQIESTVPSI